MDIKSFNIKNYRSIKDSGDCYLSGDNITILAGKNESGKTAILEALEDFSTNKSIRKEAIHLHHPDAKPEISITFQIDKGEISEILNEQGISLDVENSGIIEISKAYPNSYTYLLSNEFSQMLAKTEDYLKKDIKDNIISIYKDIQGFQAQFKQIDEKLPKLDFKDVPVTLTQINDFRNSIQPKLAQIPEVEPKDKFINDLQNIINKFGEIQKIGSIEQKIIKKLNQYIPNFILFSSFDDIFPSEIPLAEASNNVLIKDLEIISNLDIGLIKSGIPANKKRHKEQLNVELHEDYKKFWTQDLTNLSIDWDSPNLQFYIEENGYYYPPNMRSKGKQWHLAFYIRLTARAREDVYNILLVDEPGLYLHAQAQKDIIKKFEDAAKDAPVIFATHSPYLIDINKLSRIRLVLKPDEETGTVISNKIHKDIDIETLTPIITAIGLDLSMGLDIAKDNNIIFEGITDYYYLLAFEKTLNFKFDKKVHFIPGAGADKLDLLASLMLGWGLNYCVLLDNDATGIRIKSRLEKNFNPIKLKIQMASDNKDEEIEDLFTHDDFIKYVLNGKQEDMPAEKSNSQIIKQKGKNQDKVLLSKEFYEKVLKGDITLSEKTINNIKNLLDGINTLLLKE